MADRYLTFELLAPVFAIAKLPHHAQVPHWADGPTFTSITRTDEELSIVTLESTVPGDVVAARGYRCVRIAGPLDLSEIGILSAITATLAEATISVFAISTFDTDYLLLRKIDLETALATLQRHGHQIHRLPDPCDET